MASIRRETVADQSTALLRSRILTGQVRPGTPLTEEAIAEELGVSRSTVRQALNTLMLEGLLTRHPTKRILQVTQLSYSDVQDIYRARRFLELGGVEAAAQAPPEAFARINEAVQDLEKAVISKDVASFVEVDARCHAEVVALLGSRHLSAAHAQLMSKLRLAITHWHVDTRQQSNEEDLATHKEFAALITSGAIDEARANLSARLDKAERDVLGVAAP